MKYQSNHDAIANVLIFSSVHLSVDCGDYDDFVQIWLVNGDYVDHLSNHRNNHPSNWPSVISFDCDCDCIVSVIGHVPMNNCDRENHASTSRNGDVNDLMSNDRRRRHLEQVPVPKDFIDDF